MPFQLLTLFVSADNPVRDALEDLYDPFFTLLDTIIETIQGPCVGNQREFLTGPGLHAIRSLLRLNGLRRAFLFLSFLVGVQS